MAFFFQCGLCVMGDTVPAIMPTDELVVAISPLVYTSARHDIVLCLLSCVVDVTVFPAYN